jgi:hypothetical protein
MIDSSVPLAAILMCDQGHEIWHPVEYQPFPIGMHSAVRTSSCGPWELGLTASRRIVIPCIESIPYWNTEVGVDKFDAMQMFVRVVEKGSFSAVAKERGIGQPAVSKQISALEDELGTELIHRTSRSIALTEPGRDFYESALHILDDFENATSRIGRGQTTPKGLIRVTVPPTFARLHLVSKLPAFLPPTPR